ncbi:hypothetical protein EAS62_38900 [Bradyrhizobium zhanjiangense]|uniref:Uncharacterized protein n=1 Tax=Bradyrhizobium zhanjiangense TaxID=1325107 RepID=A0ABY0D8R5_9BRAD|nr:hypothetical protein EAS62_38900 [Bradyrhizobium zhanjiangense]
MLHLDSRASN